MTSTGDYYRFMKTSARAEPTTHIYQSEQSSEVLKKLFWFLLAHSFILYLSLRTEEILLFFCYSAETRAWCVCVFQFLNGRKVLLLASALFKRWRLFRSRKSSGCLLSAVCLFVDCLFAVSLSAFGCLLSVCLLSAVCLSAICLSIYLLSAVTPWSGC